MTADDDLRIRPGRIRSTRPTKAKPFLTQALRAAQKVGGIRRTGGHATASRFGRGRSASVAAARLLGNRSRVVTIKARVVRQHSSPGALGAHLRYLQRDGVTRDDEPGHLFDAKGDTADGRAFGERCEEDRHHFRFIVAPEDAHEFADLKCFARELMTQAESDLGTKLDWVAVDHWNTEHPHIHVLVRGRGEDGKDLVISRDYISQGMRARAAALVTLELGPRSELEVRRGLEAEADADRWTRLDRALAREATSRDGVVDLRPQPGDPPDPLRDIRIRRMRKLERLGLADAAGSGRWILDPHVELKLRDLAERGDIIKRLHRGLAAAGRSRAANAVVLEGERQERPVLGRLIACGLDDELKGTAYAIIDGVDGRAHHLRLPDIDAAGDGPTGSVVELRRFENAGGRQRVALAVRSDLAVEAQITANGATWLDRQLVSRAPAELARSGFGEEVREAIAARANHLVPQGLARRQGAQLKPQSDLLATLRRRELDGVAERLAAETGLPPYPAEAGDAVAGVYRRRLSLASGRFAMLDNGLGFQLVPWTPSLERHLGQHVSGVAGPGRVDWDFARKRGLSI